MGHAPPFNKSNAYWVLLGAWGSSGFIGRCRYPEVSVLGRNSSDLSKKRGLIFTGYDPYNSVGIWTNLVTLRPATHQITSEANNDYIVYEKDGKLYDIRGELASVSDLTPPAYYFHSITVEGWFTVGGWAMNVIIVNGSQTPFTESTFKDWLLERGCNGDTLATKRYTASGRYNQSGITNTIIGVTTAASYLQIISSNANQSQSTLQMHNNMVVSRFTDNVVVL